MGIGERSEWRRGRQPYLGGRKNEESDGCGLNEKIHPGRNEMGLKEVGPYRLLCQPIFSGT